MFAVPSGFICGLPSVKTIQQVFTLADGEKILFGSVNTASKLLSDKSCVLRLVRILLLPIAHDIGRIIAAFTCFLLFLSTSEINFKNINPLVGSSFSFFQSVL